MLVLSPKTVNIKATTILHLVHPRYDKHPEVLSCINSSKCQSKQVAYPGNSVIVQERIDSFSAIVIHQVDPKDIIDFSIRLSKMFDRLLNTLNDAERALYVFGDSIRTLSPTILHIPNGPNTTYNDVIVSDDIIKGIKGLNVVSCYFDLHSQLLLRNDRYRRNIQFASKSFSPMYGLPDYTAIYGNKITGHRPVCITPTKIYTYQTRQLDLPLSELDADNKPKPGKMKAFYKEDFDKDGFLVDKNDDVDIEKELQQGK